MSGRTLGHEVVPDDAECRLAVRIVLRPAATWRLPNSKADSGPALATPASDFSKPRQVRGRNAGPMIRRIHPYVSGTDLTASREFYVGLFGLEVAMEDPVLTLRSPANPTAQVLVLPPAMQSPAPNLGIDVGEPARVDTAHAKAVERGLDVVYPLTTEPWDVRRFFVRAPGGAVVNVLAHLR